jgi:hypothetical protein
MRREETYQQSVLSPAAFSDFGSEDEVINNTCTCS